MKAIYFDLATSTGWAFGAKNEGVKEFGTFELRRTGDRVGPFLVEAHSFIAELIRRFDPVIIGFEAPILVNPKRQGNKFVPHDTPAKLRKLYGLSGKVEEIAERRRIAGKPTICRECSASEVRTHFLGAGYPRKSEEVNLKLRVKCRERGWRVKNSDEANAVAGLDFLLSLENPALAVKATPLFAQA